MDLNHDACYRAISTRDARFDGRLFTGVKTTGIYCRPVCPARIPRSENVVFFATAAAAQEAGFRPCLRCRPETSPDLASWRGTSNTVSRALALIEAGALDAADVDTLAARLGVGERQLRRLFKQHVGASPIAVAQTRRILLAKKLIHETRLGMAEIAMASGFGSVRRFNETFHQLFRRPPASLRRGPESAVASGAVTLQLPYRPPYDFAALLRFLSVRAIPGIEQVNDGCYRRSIAMDDARGTIAVTQGDGNNLRVTITFPRLSALPTIIARIRRVFDLAADPVTIGAHLSEDPLLAPLVTQRPGLRVPGAWDGFELAVRAILGQQITVTAATALAGKLVHAWGERLATPQTPGITHAFPLPRVLAQADIALIGMPRSRATSISALAASVAGDPQIFGPSRSLEEATDRLRGLAGIGEWTAQYIAMRELREPDAFPASDIGLLRAVAGLTGQPRPAPAALLDMSNRWRPWRAYAAIHLWAADSAASSKEISDVTEAA